MGGSYYVSYEEQRRREVEREKYEKVQQEREKREKIQREKVRLEEMAADFFESGEVSDLVAFQKRFLDNNNAGFILALLAHHDLKTAPKEFPDIEYEVKFGIAPLHPKKGGEEPGLVEYLDAFEFPSSKQPRFLTDPVNAVSIGTNHFYGKGDEEKLVVIEKGGNLYLKEKSLPLELRVGVPFEHIVMKRTENRYQASLPEVVSKVASAQRRGAKYVGSLRKEKGDAFVLDSFDGRIYSFTVTRASIDNRVQRQLEVEYAGFVPGFENFSKDDEKQIVSGMVDMAKYLAVVNSNAAVSNGWRAQLYLSHERKYDFAANINSERRKVPLLVAK